MKNKAEKAVSKSMREKAQKAHTELKSCPNGILRLVRGLKINSKEVEIGRCMRGRDGKLYFSEKEKDKKSGKKIWKGS